MACNGAACGKAPPAWVRAALHIRWHPAGSRDSTLAMVRGTLCKARLLPLCRSPARPAAGGRGLAAAREAGQAAAALRSGRGSGRGGAGARSRGARGGGGGGRQARSGCPLRGAARRLASDVGCRPLSSVLWKSADAGACGCTQGLLPRSSSRRRLPRPARTTLACMQHLRACMPACLRCPPSLPVPLPNSRLPARFD